MTSNYKPLTTTNYSWSVPGGWLSDMQPVLAAVDASLYAKSIGSTGITGATGLTGPTGTVTTTVAAKPNYNATGATGTAIVTSSGNLYVCYAANLWAQIAGVTGYV